MNRDESPQSLADSAAEWVPPWARKAAPAEAVPVEPEPEVEPEPDVEPEPQIEAEAAAEIEPVADVEPDPVAEVEPELVGEVESEPVAGADHVVQPESAVIADVEPEADMDAEPEPVAEVESAVEVEPAFDVEVGAEQAWAGEPELTAETGGPEAADEPEPAEELEAAEELVAADELAAADGPLAADELVAADEPEGEQAEQPIAEQPVGEQPVAETGLDEFGWPAEPESAAAVGQGELAVVSPDMGDNEPLIDALDADAMSAADALDAGALGAGAVDAGAVDAEAEDEPEAVAISEEDLRGALEAILLVVDEPVAEMTLAEVLGVPTDRVVGALRGLAEEYKAAGRGFEARLAAGGWRLYTRPQYADYVEKFVLEGQQIRLTQAALETLAVVAYKQPVTRSRISAIRGVNCDGVIKTLVARGLVEECGAEPESGAFLYRTTSLFLEKLGINGVDELPPLAPFLPDNVDEFDVQR